MNDCPVCGVEFDRRVREGREQTVEVEGPRRVCAQTQFDSRDYAYSEIYIHNPIERNGRCVDTERDPQ